MGATLRYLLGGWAQLHSSPVFPTGTLTVNVLGCLGIGFLLTLGVSTRPLSEPMRLVLVTGVLGGFTTFSAFGYETHQLLRDGNVAGACLSVALNLGLGLAAVGLGALIARSI